MKLLQDPQLIQKKILEEYQFLQNHIDVPIPLWEAHCRHLHNLGWYYAVYFEKRFNKT